MLKRLYIKFQNTSDLNRFLLKGGFLFLLWRIFRKWMLLEGQYSWIVDVWADVYLKIAAATLKFLGYSVEFNSAKKLLWLENSTEAIEVVYDCLGINLLFLFTIFILSYPGYLKTKAWFIALGLTMVFFANALRMAALAIVVSKLPHLMDLFHHFIFQGAMYLLIFSLWWWFSRLSGLPKSK